MLLIPEYGLYNLNVYIWSLLNMLTWHTNTQKSRYGLKPSVKDTEYRLLKCAKAAWYGLKRKTNNFLIKLTKASHARKLGSLKYVKNRLKRQTQRYKMKIVLCNTIYVVTPTEISNTENHKNYYMTEVMCPMGSFKYNYGMWSLDICLDQTP